jgi:CubicO group peptidase (beta-lactamase class C family)
LRKLYRFSVVAIICLLFLEAFFLFSPAEERQLEEELDVFINDFLSWYALPGLAIAVVKNGKVAFAGGYGVRDVSSREPITPHTVFSTASVTKLFVGTSIMQLVESNLADLDDPIVEYLPYFKLKDERYRDITVAQMLSHTSGMPDVEADEFYVSWEDPEYDEGALERYVRSLEVVDLIASPGEKYLYSNMAYDVLGDMIAKISGISFEEYVQQHILGELGMDNSTVLYEEVEKDLLALPHLMNAEFSYEVSNIFPYSRRHPACGTLFSTVLDMSQFALANINRGELDGKRILHSSSYDIMWRPVGLDANTVGVSWMLEEIGHCRLYSHGGGDPGYRTEFYIVPEESIGIIVMANSWDVNINPIAMKALNTLLEENGTDWFTYFHGVLWKSIREEGIAQTVLLCKELIKKHDISTFHPAILNQLGNRLVDIGKMDAAAELFKLNVELYPSIYQLYNSLARTYEALGEKDLAKENYRRSLELEPGNPEASEYLERIENSEE